MPKPIVYLAFANDRDDHLALLKQESRQLMSTLSGLHDKQAIEVYRDESTSVEDLIESFNRFDGRLAVFHYGEHAGGSGLQLEEGGAQAGGLAQLFSQQQNLQLVFLNGCSTLPQVAQLMKLGVKAVIATSVPIEDTKAKDFSTWFYQALVVKRTIQSAFEFAVASLNTKYGDRTVSPHILYRSIVMGFDEEMGDELPWGLYVNEAHKDVTAWRLPDTPIQRFLANPLSHYSPNDYLPKILGAMVRYDTSLKQVIEDVRAGRKDKREVLPIIIQNLPWTIGAQLQKLISRSESMRVPGLERLQQTINTYVMAAQVILYLLASQLWGEERKKNSQVEHQPINDLLSLGESSARFYDYVDAFSKLGKVFQQNSYPPFVSEFKELFDSLEKKDHFYKSYLLLESIREQLASGSLDVAAAPQLCEEAENGLTIFIGTISFLIKYKMVAVRDITVACTRYEKVAYYHKLGSLNAADSAYLTLESDPRPFQNYAESGSILLVGKLNENKMDHFLSLSPFIIDNNAFLDKSQESLDIYLFSHVDKGEYIYKNVNSHFQKMEEHNTYTISTAYEEKIEVKDEVDFGWEFNESSTKTLQPYRVLKDQFEQMKKQLT
ncbi:MAG: hypothetical protein R2828_06645 [Saprospiraceae bacterium]